MTLDVLTADALFPATHGFFTRRGGASSGIFEGLNCGYGSSDQTEVVATNRRRVAEKLQIDPAALITVHQHHSSDVVVVKAASEAQPKADAMVTRTPGVALGVLTADCQPVLLADMQAGVIAAVHAGWIGALNGILENTIDAMVDLGARRRDISAVIGPCISQSAYEVGQDYFERFLDDNPENARFFVNGVADKLQFDLPGYGLYRLRLAGVQAEWVGHCTYRNPSRFYSYRRSVHKQEADYGRQLSVIAL